MNLNVLSRGHATPDASFEGTIHSIFQSAFNIKLHNGTLISILTNAHANQPRAFRVNVPKGFRFDHLDMHSGDPVASRGGIIRILHGTLTIDFRTALVWHCHLDSLHIDFSSVLPCAAWHSIAAIVLKHSASSRGIAESALATLKSKEFSLSSPLQTRAYCAIKDLTLAAQSNDINRALDASLRLVGLGPGLTPSGDDFLAGYITGLWTIASVNNVVEDFTGQLGAGLAPYLDRTTTISAGFLRDAINRTASETTAEVIRTIAEGQPAVLVEQATQAALDVGSTSGADSLAGVLVALAACNDNKLAISPTLRI